MNTANPHCHPASDRVRKAEKILAILQDYLGPDLHAHTCLDVGCSLGIISATLAPHFKRMVGVDVDRPAVYQAAEASANRLPGSSLPQYALGSGHTLPFADASFDVAICAQVYEHVTDQAALAREVERVLRKGGVCFFSGPNRLAVVEEHYWLPFLSWPPRPLASAYMRLFKRGQVYDAYPRFYWQIRRLWRNFEIHDYTWRMLREPQRFGVGERVDKYPWLAAVPEVVLRGLAPFYPNYNWILVKR